LLLQIAPRSSILYDKLTLFCSPLPLSPLHNSIDDFTPSFYFHFRTFYWRAVKQGGLLKKIIKIRNLHQIEASPTRTPVRAASNEDLDLFYLLAGGASAKFVYSGKICFDNP
jgi:hypothetical protein